MLRSRLVILLVSLVLLIDLIIAYSVDSPSVEPVSAQPLDALQVYAQQCDRAIGITVPDFTCDAGTLVPTTNFTPSMTASGQMSAVYPNGNCDRPNRLNRACDPGSHFQVLPTTTQDAYAVAHCRKMGNPSGFWGDFYGDIAVIQHNQKNGATCFYQALGTLYGGVRAPSKGLSTWNLFRPGNWQSPSTTASQRCGGCHDNGPLVRTPYLTQITGPNALPGAGAYTFQPYYFVGADFASWKAYKVEVKDNYCISCHRMGTNNLPGELGTALDFGMRATADWSSLPPDHNDFPRFAEGHKNLHSIPSPLWMPPGQTTFSQTNADWALAIRDCALQRTKNPLPNDDKCKITQFTGATSISVRATISPPANADGWSNADTLVTLAELPPRVSVQSITFEANGAQPIPQTTIQTSSTALTITQPGQTAILYSWTRIDGKPELPGLLVVKLDKTPPTTTATITNGNTPGESIVTLTAADETNGSGLKLIDYMASQPVAKVERINVATLRLTITASTQIHYWSTDIAGNYEGSHYRDFRPVAELKPTTLAFSSPVGVSSPPQSVTLKNIGKTTLSIGPINTDTYSFYTQNNPNNPCGAGLIPGAECQIDIVFYPFTATTYAGTLYIPTNSSPSPITMVMTGKGTVPAVEFTPLPLLFPDTTLRDTSQPQTATIRNNGEAPLLITDASTGVGADFVIQNDTCTPKPKTLQPGETCDIQVAFRPRSSGLRTGSLMLSDNVPGGQDILPLQGVGLAAPAASFSVAALDFGSQPISTSGAPLALVLTNVGTAELHITALSLGGPNATDFSITGGTCNPDPGIPVVVVLPEQTCEVAVQFAPTALGNRTADLLFTTNVPGQPQQAVSLIGVGTATPLVALSPTNLVFAAWPVNSTPSSPTKIVTLTNRTSSPLTIRTVGIVGAHPGDFAIIQGSDTCSRVTVVVRGSCTVEVTFAPTAVGDRTAQLRFVDLARNIHTVSSAGTGNGALISFDPPNLIFEDLPLGAFSQVQKLTLRNVGNAILTVNGVSATGDFLQSTWCAFVGPGSYCEISVVFRPSAGGVRTGQIIVSSDAVGAPPTFNLTGTGLAASIALNPSSVTFAKQSVGTSSAPQDINLTSNGMAALSINSITLNGDFELAGHTCIVNPGYQPSGTSCVIKVIFKPATTGVLTGVLIITTNAPSSPHIVALSGSGI